jgi:hypothetical protein
MAGPAKESDTVQTQNYSQRHSVDPEICDPHQSLGLVHTLARYRSVMFIMLLVSPATPQLSRPACFHNNRILKYHFCPLSVRQNTMMERWMLSPVAD